jgi:hypothetical protein
MTTRLRFKRDSFEEQALKYFIKTGEPKICYSKMMWERTRLAVRPVAFSLRYLFMLRISDKHTFP